MWGDDFFYWADDATQQIDDNIRELNEWWSQHGLSWLRYTSVIGIVGGDAAFPVPPFANATWRLLVGENPRADENTIQALAEYWTDEASKTAEIAREVAQAGQGVQVVWLGNGAPFVFQDQLREVSLSLMGLAQTQGNLAMGVNQFVIQVVRAKAAFRAQVIMLLFEFVMALAFAVPSLGTSLLAATAKRGITLAAIRLAMRKLLSEIAQVGFTSFLRRMGRTALTGLRNRPLRIPPGSIIRNPGRILPRRPPTPYRPPPRIPPRPPGPPPRPPTPPLAQRAFNGMRNLPHTVRGLPQALTRVPGAVRALPQAVTRVPGAAGRRLGNRWAPTAAHRQATQLQRNLLRRELDRLRELRATRALTPDDWARVAQLKSRDFHRALANDLTNMLRNRSLGHPGAYTRLTDDLADLARTAAQRSVDNGFTTWRGIRSSVVGYGVQSGLKFGTAGWAIGEGVTHMSLNSMGVGGYQTTIASLAGSITGAGLGGAPLALGTRLPAMMVFGGIGGGLGFYGAQAAELAFTPGADWGAFGESLNPGLLLRAGGADSPLHAVLAGAVGGAWERGIGEFAESGTHLVPRPSISVGENVATSIGDFRRAWSLGPLATAGTIPTFNAVDVSSMLPPSSTVAPPAVPQAAAPAAPGGGTSTNSGGEGGPGNRVVVSPDQPAGADQSATPQVNEASNGPVPAADDPAQVADHSAPPAGEQSTGPATPVPTQDGPPEGPPPPSPARPGVAGEAFATEAEVPVEEEDGPAAQAPVVPGSDPVVQQPARPIIPQADAPVDGQPAAQVPGPPAAESPAPQQAEDPAAPQPPTGDQAARPTIEDQVVPPAAEDQPAQQQAENQPARPTIEDQAGQQQAEDPAAPQPPTGATAPGDEVSSTQDGLPAGESAASDGELVVPPARPAELTLPGESNQDFADPRVREVAQAVLDQVAENPDDLTRWKPVDGGWLVRGTYDGASIVVMVDEHGVAQDVAEGYFAVDTTRSLTDAANALYAILPAGRIVDPANAVYSMALPGGSTVDVQWALDPGLPEGASYVAPPTFTFGRDGWRQTAPATIVLSGTVRADAAEMMRDYERTAVQALQRLETGLPGPVGESSVRAESGRAGNVDGMRPGEVRQAPPVSVSVPTGESPAGGSRVDGSQADENQSQDGRENQPGDGREGDSGASAVAESAEDASDRLADALAGLQSEQPANGSPPAGSTVVALTGDPAEGPKLVHYGDGSTVAFVIQTSPHLAPGEVAITPATWVFDGQEARQAGQPAGIRVSDRLPAGDTAAQRQMAAMVAAALRELHGTLPAADRPQQSYNLVDLGRLGNVLNPAGEDTAEPDRVFLMPDPLPPADPAAPPTFLVRLPGNDVAAEAQAALDALTRGGYQLSGLRDGWAEGGVPGLVVQVDPPDGDMLISPRPVTLRLLTPEALAAHQDVARLAERESLSDSQVTEVLAALAAENPPEGVDQVRIRPVTDDDPAAPPTRTPTQAATPDPAAPPAARSPRATDSSSETESPAAPATPEPETGTRLVQVDGYAGRTDLGNRPELVERVRDGYLPQLPAVGRVPGLESAAPVGDTGLWELTFQGNTVQVWIATNPDLPPGTAVVSPGFIELSSRAAAGMTGRSVTAALLARAVTAYGGLVSDGSVTTGGEHPPPAGRDQLFSRGGSRTNVDVLENGGGVPLSLDAVRQAAELIGIDLSGVQVTVITDPDYVRYLDYMQAVAVTPAELNGTEIHLGPAAFADVESLVATVAHEFTHVEQLRRGAALGTGELGNLEDAAYASEAPALERFRERVRSGRYDADGPLFSGEGVRPPAAGRPAGAGNSAGGRDRQGDGPAGRDDRGAHDSARDRTVDTTGTGVRPEDARAGEDGSESGGRRPGADQSDLTGQDAQRSDVNQDDVNQDDVNQDDVNQDDAYPAAEQRRGQPGNQPGRGFGSGNRTGADLTGDVRTMVAQARANLLDNLPPSPGRERRLAALDQIAAQADRLDSLTRQARATGDLAALRDGVRELSRMVRQYGDQPSLTQFDSGNRRPPVMEAWRDLEGADPLDPAELASRRAAVDWTTHRFHVMDQAIIGAALEATVPDLAPAVIAQLALAIPLHEEHAQALLSERDYALVRTEVLDEATKGLHDGRLRKIFLRPGRSLTEIASSAVHETTHTQQPDWRAEVRAMREAIDDAAALDRAVAQRKFEREYEAFQRERSFLQALTRYRSHAQLARGDHEAAIPNPEYWLLDDDRQVRNEIIRRYILNMPHGFALAQEVFGYGEAQRGGTPLVGQPERAMPERPGLPGHGGAWDPAANAAAATGAARDLATPDPRLPPDAYGPRFQWVTDPAQGDLLVAETSGQRVAFRFTAGIVPDATVAVTVATGEQTADGVPIYQTTVSSTIPAADRPAVARHVVVHAVTDALAQQAEPSLADRLRGRRVDAPRQATLAELRLELTDLAVTGQPAPAGVRQRIGQLLEVLGADTRLDRIIAELTAAGRSPDELALVRELAAPAADWRAGWEAQRRAAAETAVGDALTAITDQLRLLHGARLEPAAAGAGPVVRVSVANDTVALPAGALLDALAGSDAVGERLTARAAAELAAGIADAAGGRLDPFWQGSPEQVAAQVLARLADTRSVADSGEYVRALTDRLPGLTADQLDAVRNEPLPPPLAGGMPGRLAEAVLVETLSTVSGSGPGALAAAVGWRADGGIVLFGRWRGRHVPPGRVDAIRAFVQGRFEDGADLHHARADLASVLGAELGRHRAHAPRVVGALTTLSRLWSAPGVAPSGRVAAEEVAAEILAGYALHARDWRALPAAAQQLVEQARGRQPSDPFAPMRPGYHQDLVQRVGQDAGALTSALAAGTVPPSGAATPAAALASASQRLADELGQAAAGLDERAAARDTAAREARDAAAEQQAAIDQETRRLDLRSDERSRTAEVLRDRERATAARHDRIAGKLRTARDAAAAAAAAYQALAQELTTLPVAPAAEAATRAAALDSLATAAAQAFDEFGVASRATRPVSLDTAVAPGGYPYLRALTARVNAMVAAQGVPATVQPDELQRMLRANWSWAASPEGALLSLGFSSVDVRIAFVPGEPVEVPNPAQRIAEIVHAQIPLYPTGSRVFGATRTRTVGGAITVPLGRLVNAGAELVPGDGPVATVAREAMRRFRFEYGRGGSTRLSVRGAGMPRFTVPGQVGDNRGDSTVLHVNGHYVVQARRAGAGTRWTPVERVDSPAPGDLTGLELALEHAYTEPAPAAFAQLPAQPAGAHFPEHSLIRLTELDTLNDQVLELMGTTGEVARQQVRAMVRQELPARLDAAMNHENGFQRPIYDRGQAVAMVRIKTTVEWVAQPPVRVGTASDQHHLERLRVAFAGYEGGTEVGGARNRAFNTGFSVLPVAEAAGGQAANAGAMGGYTHETTWRDGVATGTTAIRPNVQRYTGFTQAYRIQLVHRVTVQRLDTGEVVTGDPITGDGVFRLPEAAAYRYGLPVDADAVVERDAAGNPVRLRGDRQPGPPPGRQPRPPSWLGAGGIPGAGPALVRHLTGVSEVRTQVEKALRDRGWLPARSSDPARTGGWGDLSSNPMVRAAEVANLLELDELSAVRLEGAYDQAAQDGITLGMTRHRPGRVSEHLTLRVRIHQDWDNAVLLGHTIAETDVSLDIGSHRLVRQMGESRVDAGAGQGGADAGTDNVLPAGTAGVTGGGGIGAGGRHVLNAGWEYGDIVNHVKLIEGQANGLTAVFRVPHRVEVVEVLPNGGERELGSHAGDAEVGITGDLLPAAGNPMPVTRSAAPTSRRVLQQATLLHLDTSGLWGTVQTVLPHGTTPGTSSYDHLAAFADSRSLMASPWWLYSELRTDLAVDPRTLAPIRSSLAVRGTPGTSEFVGAADLVVADVNLTMNVDGATFGTQVIGAADVTGRAGAVDGGAGLGGGSGSANAERARGDSRTSTRIYGRERLSIENSLHYLFRMRVDIAVTGVEHPGFVLGTETTNTETARDRTVVYALSERAALALYADGEVALPQQQVADALRRWADGNLHLDRATVVGMLVRLHEAGVAAGTVARDTFLPSGVLRAGRGLARALAQRLAGLLPPGATLPARGVGRRVGAAVALLQQVVDPPVVLPEHLIGALGQGGIEPGARFTRQEPDGTQGPPVDLSDEVQRLISEVTPDPVGQLPGLSQGWAGQLAGEGWTGKLDRMLDGGWVFDFPIRRGLTVETVTVRLSATLGDGTLVGQTDTTGLGTQDYAFAQHDLAGSRGWSYGGGASGNSAVTSTADGELGADRGYNGQAWASMQATRIQRVTTFEGMADRVARDLTITVDVTRSGEPIPGWPGSAHSVVTAPVVHLIPPGLAGTSGAGTPTAPVAPPAVPAPAVPPAVPAPGAVPTTTTPPAAPGQQAGPVPAAAPAAPAPGQRVPGRLPHRYFVESVRTDELGPLIRRVLSRPGVLGQANVDRLETPLARQLSALPVYVGLERMTGPAGHPTVTLPIPGRPGRAIQVFVRAEPIGEPRVVSGDRQAVGLGQDDRQQHILGYDASRDRLAPIGRGVSGDDPAFGTGVGGRVTSGASSAENVVIRRGDRDETKVFDEGTAHTVAVDIRYTVTVVEKSIRPDGPERVISREVIHEPATGVAYLTMYDPEHTEVAGGGATGPAARLRQFLSPPDPGRNGSRWFRRGGAPAVPSGTSTTATVLAGAPGGRGVRDPAGTAATMGQALAGMADRFEGMTVHDDGSVTVLPRGADYALRFVAGPERDGLRGYREPTGRTTADGRPIIQVTVVDSIPVGRRLAPALTQRDVWIRRVVVHELAEAAAVARDAPAVRVGGRLRAPDHAHGRPDALVRGGDPALTVRSAHDQAHRAEVIDLVELGARLRDSGALVAAEEVERQLGLLLDALGVGVPDPSDPDAAHAAGRLAVLDLPAGVAAAVAPLLGPDAAWRTGPAEPLLRLPRHPESSRYGADMTGAQLADARLVVRDGVVYDVTGRRFDSRRISADGRVLYVMDERGDLYAASPATHRHSAFPLPMVAGAGTMVVHDGQLIYLDGQSREYAPPPEHVRQVVRALERAGADLTGRVHYPPPPPVHDPYQLVGGALDAAVDRVAAALAGTGRHPAVEGIVRLPGEPIRLQLRGQPPVLIDLAPMASTLAARGVAGVALHEQLAGWLETAVTDAVAERFTGEPPAAVPAPAGGQVLDAVRRAAGEVAIEWTVTAGGEHAAVVRPARGRPIAFRVVPAGAGTPVVLAPTGSRPDLSDTVLAGQSTVEVAVPAALLADPARLDRLVGRALRAHAAELTHRRTGLAGVVRRLLGSGRGPNALGHGGSGRTLTVHDEQQVAQLRSLLADYRQAPPGPRAVIAQEIVALADELLKRPGQNGRHSQLLLVGDRLEVADLDELLGEVRQRAGIAAPAGPLPVAGALVIAPHAASPVAQAAAARAELPVPPPWTGGFPVVRTADGGRTWVAELPAALALRAEERDSAALDALVGYVRAVLSEAAEPAMWHEGRPPRVELTVPGGIGTSLARRLEHVRVPFGGRDAAGVPLPRPRAVVTAPRLFTDLPALTLPPEIVAQDLRDGVAYFDAEQRQVFAVQWRGGLAYDAEGLPLHGWYDFVTEPGTLRTYAVRNDRQGNGTHGSFLAGGEVASAGELQAESGRIVWLNNRSGHYLPVAAYLWSQWEMMLAQGVDPSRMDLIPHGPPATEHAQLRGARLFAAAVAEIGQPGEIEGVRGIERVVSSPVARRDDRGVPGAVLRVSTADGRTVDIDVSNVAGFLAATRPSGEDIVHFPNDDRLVFSTDDELVWQGADWLRRRIESELAAASGPGGSAAGPPVTAAAAGTAAARQTLADLDVVLAGLLGAPRLLAAVPTGGTGPAAPAVPAAAGTAETRLTGPAALAAAAAVRGFDEARIAAVVTAAGLPAAESTVAATALRARLAEVTLRHRVAPDAEEMERLLAVSDAWLGTEATPRQLYDVLHQETFLRRGESTGWTVPEAAELLDHAESGAHSYQRRLEDWLSTSEGRAYHDAMLALDLAVNAPAASRPDPAALLPATGQPAAHAAGQELPATVWEALDRYDRHRTGDVDSYVESDGERGERAREDALRIQAAMRESTADLVLHAAVPLRALGLDLPARLPGLRGTTLTLNRFVRATTGTATPDQVRLVVEAPAGTRMARLGPDATAEVLLAAGTRFQVLELTRAGADSYLLRVRVVGQQDPPALAIPMLPPGAVTATVVPGTGLAGQVAAQAAGSQPAPAAGRQVRTLRELLVRRWDGHLGAPGRGDAFTRGIEPGQLVLDPDSNEVTLWTTVHPRRGAPIPATIQFRPLGTDAAGRPLRATTEVVPGPGGRGRRLLITISDQHPADDDLLVTLSHEVAEVLTQLRRQRHFRLPGWRWPGRHQAGVGRHRAARAPSQVPPPAAPEPDLLAPGRATAPVRGVRLSPHDVGGIADLVTKVLQLVASPDPAVRARLAGDIEAIRAHLGLDPSRDGTDAVTRWRMVDALVGGRRLPVGARQHLAALHRARWREHLFALEVANRLATDRPRLSTGRIRTVAVTRDGALEIQIGRGRTGTVVVRVEPAALPPAVPFRTYPDGAGAAVVQIPEAVRNDPAASAVVAAAVAAAATETVAAGRGRIRAELRRGLRTVLRLPAADVIAELGINEPVTGRRPSLAALAQGQWAAATIAARQVATLTAQLGRTADPATRALVERQRDQARDWLRDNLAAWGLLDGQVDFVNRREAIGRLRDAAQSDPVAAELLRPLTRAASEPDAVMLAVAGLAPVVAPYAGLRGAQPAAGEPVLLVMLENQLRVRVRVSADLETDNPRFARLEQDGTEWRLRVRPDAGRPALGMDMAGAFAELAARLTGRTAAAELATDMTAARLRFLHGWHRVAGPLDRPVIQGLAERQVDVLTRLDPAGLVGRPAEVLAGGRQFADRAAGRRRGQGRAERHIAARQAATDVPPRWMFFSGRVLGTLVGVPVNLVNGLLAGREAPLMLGQAVSTVTNNMLQAWKDGSLRQVLDREQQLAAFRAAEAGTAPRPVAPAGSTAVPAAAPPSGPLRVARSAAGPYYGKRAVPTITSAAGLAAFVWYFDEETGPEALWGALGPLLYGFAYGAADHLAEQPEQQARADWSYVVAQRPEGVRNASLDAAAYGTAELFQRLSELSAAGRLDEQLPAAERAALVAQQRETRDLLATMLDELERQEQAARAAIASRRRMRRLLLEAFVMGPARVGWLAIKAPGWVAWQGVRLSGRGISQLIRGASRMLPGRAGTPAILPAGAAPVVATPGPDAPLPAGRASTGQFALRMLTPSLAGAVGAYAAGVMLDPASANFILLTSLASAAAGLGVGAGWGVQRGDEVDDALPIATIRAAADARDALHHVERILELLGEPDADPGNRPRQDRADEPADAHPLSIGFVKHGPAVAMRLAVVGAAGPVMLPGELGLLLATAGSEGVKQASYGAGEGLFRRFTSRFSRDVGRQASADRARQLALTPLELAQTIRAAAQEANRAAQPPPGTSTTATVLDGAPGGQGVRDPAGTAAAIRLAAAGLGQRFRGMTILADGSVEAAPRGADYLLRFTPGPERDGLRGYREMTEETTPDGRRVIQVTVVDSIPVGDRLSLGLTQRDVWVRRVVVHELAEAAALARDKYVARPDTLGRDGDPTLWERSAHDTAHRAEVVDLVDLAAELRGSYSPAVAEEVERQLVLLLRELGVVGGDPSAPIRMELLDLPHRTTEKLMIISSAQTLAYNQTAMELYGRQGFAGLYHPPSEAIHMRFSGPNGLVPRFGGHGDMNREVFEGSRRTVGFTVVSRGEGLLEIRWNSRSVNGQNFDSREAPVRFREAIIEAVRRATGMEIE